MSIETKSDTNEIIGLFKTTKIKYIQGYAKDMLARNITEENTHNL